VYVVPGSCVHDLSGARARFVKITTWAAQWSENSKTPLAAGPRWAGSISGWCNIERNARHPLIHCQVPPDSIFLYFTWLATIARIMSHYVKLRLQL
jgi:hypothetical protein